MGTEDAEKQTTMTISIAPELKKIVKATAKKEYQNYSAWVVEAIKEKLERDEHQAKRRRRK